MGLLSLTVTPEQVGVTVKHIVRSHWHLSSTLLKSLKWQGAIRVNGAPVTVAYKLQAGDVLTVDITDTGRESSHILPVDFPLDILYEDEDLLIINKPAGIAVHSAALTEETVTVAGAVSHYLGGAVFHPVNRLDRGTTGIMAVAKNGYMHARCMAILHTDAFRREYRGICEGIPSPRCGTIDLPIGRDDASLLRRKIASDGLPSQSEYEVLQTGNDRALLRLRPLTGRTHQLRVHLSAIGHPLVGDWLYGTENRALIARPALHSYELWLMHPLQERVLHLKAPIPEDMETLLSSSEAGHPL
ncbi:MAG: RluA family pseudouridine synthase [Clostridiales bacterium]|nr:RluA family pseudouridine synthase [Candidatus Cacconaster stercorequi]